MWRGGPRHSWPALGEAGWSYLAVEALADPLAVLLHAWLAAGKALTSFMLCPPRHLDLPCAQVVPWLLEDKMKELGGTFERSDADWASHAVK